MKIAITGGIGSGKSYVCRLLEQRGIDVYDCDAAAKRLMRTSAKLQQQLKALVGEEVYTTDGVLQKRVLAVFLLASDTNKLRINDIVHPAVAADFIASGKQWLESAILFESGFDKRVDFDFTISVTAPREVRIQRIVQRDGITPERAAEWIDVQMSEEEIIERSDFRIVNDGKSDVQAQINEILKHIKTHNK